MAIVSLVDNAAQGKSVASKAAWIDLVAAEAGILRPPPAIAVILGCLGLTRGKKGRARKKSRNKQLPHRLNFLVPGSAWLCLKCLAIPGWDSRVSALCRFRLFASHLHS
jgi:hypothetical protein